MNTKTLPGNIFNGCAWADERGNVKHWILAALIEKRYTLTGYNLTSESAFWEMRKAAETLDTPMEKLTAFKTENGWQHFLLPGESLGGGYTSRAILS